MCEERDIASNAIPGPWGLGIYLMHKYNIKYDIDGKLVGICARMICR